VRIGEEDRDAGLDSERRSCSGRVLIVAASVFLLAP
jgi:hypothetical protein